MMINNYNTIQELESSIKDLETTIELIYDAIASNLSKFPEKTKEIENVYKPRIDWHQGKISEKVDKNLLSLIFRQQHKNIQNLLL